MTDKYKGFKVLGDRLLVKVVERPEKTSSGLLYLPENSGERPPVVQILAKGPGKFTKTVYKDHWYPGSKKWGKAGHEVPIKGHGKDTEDIEVGDYCITIHPYLKSDEIVLDGEKCHIIQSFEIAGIIEFEEGETPEDINQIEMKRISVGG